MGYRVVMVVLFGVVLHSFLSLAVLAGCLQAAGCLARHEVVAVLAGVTLLLGAVFNRNVYCGMLCPYGQAQDLATTLCRRRPRKAPVWMRRLFPWLRAGVLCVVVLSLWTGQFLIIRCWSRSRCFIRGPQRCGRCCWESHFWCWRCFIRGCGVWRCARLAGCFEF